ncbi:MAG: hypothetical protein DLM60_15255 [Pseudonocardiales bacterium]|nr:DUF2127 domain-containing protein [Actinomycetota bacterium]PZS16640.1 MAG: hypothetical protein DLM60_15255 [Pseudonocardiales bacterium]
MASAAEPSRRLGAPARSARSRGDQDQSRLLPVLAVERALRAVLLVGVGLILLTHTHTDWADPARRFAEQIGLDPSRNETGRLVSRLAGFGPRQTQRFGSIAIGYGLLEAVEGYGLFRRRQWAEYLTVVSTALLLFPEVQELFKHPTGLKVGGLALNMVIVAYLIIRLVRCRR